MDRTELEKNLASGLSILICLNNADGDLVQAERHTLLRNVGVVDGRRRGLGS